MTSIDYDAQGLRMKKSTPTEKVRYTYNNSGRVIGEANASFAVQANYVWRPDRLLQKSESSSNNSYYYLHNAHGDVVQIVDRNGQVVNAYKYDEWGNLTYEQESIDNSFKYAGEIYDEEAGLYYLRARYYDPGMGRFINKDTYEGDIANPLSLNLYTYVHNNPLKYIDPTGHWIDIVVDLGFIVYDVVKLVINPTDPTNWYALGADVAGALTPGGTGFGMAVRGLDNTSDLAKSLSKLSKQERINALTDGKLVMSYKELKKITKGTGLEAHHLVEKRFAKQLGVKKNDIPSIALDKETHAKVTELYRKYLPYNKTKGAEVTTSTAKLQDIWNATKNVYTEINMTEYLNLLKPYFEGVKY